MSLSLSLSQPPNSFCRRKYYYFPPVRCLLVPLRLFATPWTGAGQSPLPMGLSWQEYWSGLSFPFPRDLPNPGIEAWETCVSCLLHWQADSLPAESPRKPIFPLELFYAFASMHRYIYIYVYHLCPRPYIKVIYVTCCPAPCLSSLNSSRKAFHISL